MFLDVSLPAALRTIAEMSRDPKTLFTVDIFRYIADRCGVHPRYPYRWADETKPIPAEHSEKILDALAELPVPMHRILDQTANVLKSLARAEEGKTVEPATVNECRTNIRRVIVTQWLAYLALERKAGIR